jgi:PAT family beta-lactamase induction signal transducer AmpG
MLASGAGVIALAAWFGHLGIPLQATWTFGYLAAAALMGVGLIASLLATEPPAPENLEKNLNPVARVLTTAFGAFQEFLTRDAAVLILLFVVLYKFCDAFAGVLTAPFVISIGFDKAVYAAIVKGVGFAAALIGGFFGGMVARAWPLSTSLWIGGILQMVSNLAFSWLALIGTSVPALTATIVFENFTGSIATVIFVAYLSALCGVRLHTATQFALLTALAAVGRTTLASGGGFVVEETGWALFFVITSLAAIPGLALLAWLQMRGHFRELEKRARD